MINKIVYFLFLFLILQYIKFKLFEIYLIIL